MEALDALNNEFEDRFGPIPEEVKNLIFQIKVKILAERAGFASVATELEQIVLRYPPQPQDEKLNLKELHLPGYFVRSGRNSYWFSFRKYGEGWQEMLLEILSELAELSPMLTANSLSST